MMKKLIILICFVSQHFCFRFSVRRKSLDEYPKQGGTSCQAHSTVIPQTSSHWCKCDTGYSTVMSKEGEGFNCSKPTDIGCDISVVNASHTYLVSHGSAGFNCSKPTNIGCDISVVNVSHTYLVSHDSAKLNFHKPIQLNVNISTYKISIWDFKATAKGTWHDVTSEASTFFSFSRHNLTISNMDTGIWTGQLIKVQFGGDVSRLCFTLKVSEDIRYPLNITSFKIRLRNLTTARKPTTSTNLTTTFTIPKTTTSTNLTATSTNPTTISTSPTKTSTNTTTTPTSTKTTSTNTTTTSTSPKTTSTNTTTTSTSTKTTSTNLTTTSTTLLTIPTSPTSTRSMITKATGRIPTTNSTISTTCVTNTSKHPSSATKSNMTTNNTPTTETVHHNNNNGVIYGVTIGILIVGLMLVVAVIYYRKVRKGKVHCHPQFDHNVVHASTESHHTSLPGANSDLIAMKDTPTV